ncbi:MAG: hypothetical protein KDB69_06165 [Acidimicrobiia bacterium]|nr:hypothetical protein [Acidimicrobiia bacterium]
MDPELPPDTGTGRSPSGDEDPGWPISFLLLVAAGAIYLALRLVQFIADVVR